MFEKKETFPSSEYRIEAVDHSQPVKKLGRIRRVIANALLGASLMVGGAATLEAQQVQEPAKQITEAKAFEREKLLNKYEADFGAMEAEITVGNIRGKVATLKKEYGGAIDNFIAMHLIDRDLEILQKIEEKKDNPETFVRSDNPYVMTPGSIVSSAYEARWTKKELEHVTFSKENLEIIPDFDAAKFDEVIQQYPEAYLESSLSGVQFDPKPNVRDGVEILGEVKAYSMDRLLENKDQRSPMTIYNTLEGMNFEEFVDVFRHEIHHPNDWLNSRVLTSAERIDMLTDVGARVESDDRYQSPYVEGINENEAAQRIKGLPEGTTLHQLLLLAKANEYWAEIAKAYFQGPEEFEKIHPKNAAIVERWVEHLSGQK